MQPGFFLISEALMSRRLASVFFAMVVLTAAMGLKTLVTVHGSEWPRADTTLSGLIALDPQLYGSGSQAKDVCPDP